MDQRPYVYVGLEMRVQRRQKVNVKLNKINEHRHKSLINTIR